jgi:hypothetical protein
MMEERKIPFSQVSHIDCYTMNFATTLRGGYDKDEPNSLTGLTSKQEAELTNEVKEKIEKELQTKRQCELLPCKRLAVELMKVEMEVSDA